VSGPAQLSGSNGSNLTITGAGTIVVKAIQEGYQQYEAAAPVTRTLMVSPAVLTVTGPTVTTTYGSAIDPITFPTATISGFVGADTQSSILTGTAQYTLQPATPNVGTYPIIVSLGTLTLVAAAAPNYVFATPVNGTLIVNGAIQTINFNPVPAGQTYGQFITLTAAATSGLPVTFTTTGPSIFYNNINNVLELKGVGTVTVTATQAGTGNYAAATSVTQTISVAPAPLQVVAKLFTREQGTPNPTLTYTIGCPNSTSQPGCFALNDSDIPSVITGIPDLTTAATDSSITGTYPIVITQGTLSAPNDAFVFVNGTLTVLPPGNFSITANPTSLTIPRGQSGLSTITITPANNYQGSVSLSCGQMPANVSCVVSPSTFTFPGSQNPDGSENAAQGTITINTDPVSSGAASVGILNSTGTALSTLTVGNGAVGIDVDPLTHLAYVANASDDTLSTINETTTTVTNTIPVSSFFLAVNPVTEKIYVSPIDSVMSLTVVTEK
jgi:YVTN family beta-propeller protein